MTSHHPGRGAAAAALAGFALLAGGLASPATAATSTAMVKGVITLEGAPVPFARVQLYRDISKDTEHPEYVRVKTASSDGAGRYTLAKVPVLRGPAGSGGYRVVVTDRPGNVVKTVRKVVPRAGRSVTRNVATSRGAIITGTVARADGGDVRALAVDLRSNEVVNDDHVPVFDTARSAVVAPDGTFTIGGVAPGSYEGLSVDGGPYDAQCFDVVASGLADCDEGTAPQRITVVAGERRALAPVTVTKLLPPSTTFAGRVTNTSGGPLEGISVRIESVAGVVYSTAETRSSGRFTVRGIVPAGRYKVRVYDAKVWTTRFPGAGTGTVVPLDFAVTPGQPVRGLDATLKSRSAVKVASKGGRGSATVAFRIRRVATGSAPGGTVTLTDGTTSRTVAVTKGRATVTLTGLPRGKRRLVATYSGTGSTAGFSKVVVVRVT